MSGRRGPGRVWAALATLVVGVLVPLAATSDEEAAAEPVAPAVFALGTAPDLGSPTQVTSPITGIAAPSYGGGYWLVLRNGQTLAFGNAIGTTSGSSFATDTTGIAASGAIGGFWALRADSSATPGGFAPFISSGPFVPPPDAAVDIVSSPINTPGSEYAYWVLLASGVIRAAGGNYLAPAFPPAPVNGRTAVALAPTADAQGMWVLDREGRVYALGTAPDLGDAVVGAHDRAVAIVARPQGDGYWVATASGRIEAFGGAPSFDPVAAGAPIVGLAATPDGNGLWVASEGHLPGGTVSGTVTGADGLISACITATSVPSNVTTFATSDRVGRYVLSPPAGQARLQFTDCQSRRTNVSQYWDDQPVSTRASLVTIAADRALAGLDAVLRPGGSIHGRVRTDTGVSPGIVCINATTTEGTFRSGFTTSDTDGVYRMDGLEAGDYTVSFRPCGPSASSFATVFWPDAPSFQSAGKVHVELEVDTPLSDVVLRTAGSVEGVVRIDGTPAPGACVSAVGPDNASFSFQQTSVTGYYRLPGIPPMDLRVRVDPCSSGPGRASTYAPGTSFEAATVYSLGSGQAIAGVDVDLPLASSVFGVVSDESGTPIPSACVNLLGTGGGVVAVTSVTGYYRLGGLSADRYRARISPCGGPTFPSQFHDRVGRRVDASAITVGPGADVSADLQVRMTSGDIDGVITDTDGALVSGVCVSPLEPDGTPSGPRATTTVTGYYRLPAVPGPYQLEFGPCTLGIGTYDRSWWNGAASFADADTLQVGPDGARADAVLRRSPASAAPPTVVSTTAGDGRVDVTWSDIAGAIGYEVRTSDGTSRIVDAASTSAGIEGLANGLPVGARVRAIVADGAGAWSEPGNTVTPTGRPGTVGRPSVLPMAGGLRVSWRAPSTGGSPITSYTVVQQPGEVARTVTSGTTSLDVTGLDRSSAWTFTVTATNASGDGPASLPSAPARPLAVPGAPAIVSASAGIHVATVTWSAPDDDGGAVVTDFQVETDAGDTTFLGGGARSATLPAVDGVDVRLRVRAWNVVGASEWSDWSAAVRPPTVPSAPTSVTASISGAYVVVSWTAPSTEDVAAPVQGYVIESPVLWYGGATTDREARSLSFWLPEGTTTTFTVQAFNAVGRGPGVTTPPITAPSRPGAPTSTATPDVRTAHVSWQPPSFDGGTPITGYAVYATSEHDARSYSVGADARAFDLPYLIPGDTYTIVVYAINAVGYSSPSNSTSVRIPVPPAAPPSVSAIAGVNEATISWTASPDEPGFPTQQYVITVSGGATVVVPASAPLSYVWTGLNGGDPVSFSVQGRNAAGDGPATESPTVTPKGRRAPRPHR